VQKLNRDREKKPNPSVLRKELAEIVVEPLDVVLAVAGTCFLHSSFISGSDFLSKFPGLFTGGMQEALFFLERKRDKTS